MTPVPPTHWLIDDYYDPDPTAPDKTYGRRGGFLDPVDFDPMGFGVPPSLVPSTDTSQLLALIVAQQVLDDAVRGQFAELDRSRVSVILGVTSGQELLGAMVSRLSGRCGCRAAASRRARGRRPGGVRRRSPTYIRTGRRARSPGCSATWSPAASPTASTSAAPTA